MIVVSVLVGCIIGALIGINSPIIPYTYSGYLAVAIIAAIDSVFGAFVGMSKNNFDMKIFVSGFFGNSILAIVLTYLGEKLNIDIYLAAIVVFVGRIFTNLSILRRQLMEKYSNKKIISKAKDVIKSSKNSEKQ